MSAANQASAGDWLAVCRRASEAISALLAQRVTVAQRVRETGTIGGGGDRTLEIDAAAEAAVFDELERLRAEGRRFGALSEERGAVDLSGGDPGGGNLDDGAPTDAGALAGAETLVVIDPIDGSLNAKRGLSHHALSVAVASGTTMADVHFGYVYEFGTGEEWWAARGAGAFLNDVALDVGAGARRLHDGRLELVGIESMEPRRLARLGRALEPCAYRLRSLGALAPALCQVAAARLDGMISLRRCRAVDVAAAQLIVREAGGRVSFPEQSPPLSGPLDLKPRAHVLAARDGDALTALEAAWRRV